LLEEEEEPRVALHVDEDKLQQVEEEEEKERELQQVILLLHRQIERVLLKQRAKTSCRAEDPLPSATIRPAKFLLLRDDRAVFPCLREEGAREEAEVMTMDLLKSPLDA